MKRNDITKLHQKTIEELVAELNEIEVRFRQARLEEAADKLKNRRELHSLRKDIARYKTIIREKELAQKAAEVLKADEAAKKPKEESVEKEPKTTKTKDKK